MLAVAAWASANRRPATARSTAATVSARPRSLAMVYRATTGPTMVSENPLNAFCKPRNDTRQNRNTGHGNLRRTTSGNVVTASATNTCTLGTTFTMPRYWRSARSGITMDEAANMSCTQPNRNAAAVTATSNPQSLGPIGRLFIRKVSMTPYYATRPRCAIPQPMYVRPMATFQRSRRSSSSWRVCTSSLE